MNDWRFLVKVVLCVSLLRLLFGSLLPPRDVPVQGVNDKLLHFAAYALVGVLATLAFDRTNHRVRCLILLTLLGVVLEFGQMIVPGRAFDVADMAANGCGTFAAFTTVRVIPAT